MSGAMSTPIIWFQFTHPGKGATAATGAVSLFAGEFQFTHPGKGATCAPRLCISALPCFNSRTLGRVRRVRTTFDVASLPVSIHAPWEGCDYTLQHLKLHWVKVSIHAPWEGCDTTSHSPSSNDARFNLRTLGRVRLNHLSASASFDTFQFTHPGKGATSRRALCLSPYGVSIHAPWEGCDRRRPPILRLPLCFNSRTLGRVRLSFQKHSVLLPLFQFTHPGKGATSNSAPRRVDI